MLRRVYGPASGTPSGYIIPDLQEFTCDACRGSGTVPGYSCRVCAGWCYEGDQHAPAVTRDGRCGRCVEDDLDRLQAAREDAPERSEAYDPGRNAWAARGVAWAGPVGRALQLSALSGGDVSLPVYGVNWTIRLTNGRKGSIDEMVR